jgi:hypothetical protein
MPLFVHKKAQSIRKPLWYEGLGKREVCIMIFFDVRVLTGEIYICSLYCVPIGQVLSKLSPNVAMV